MRAKVIRKVVEIIEKADRERDQKISYILGIGNGNLEEIISYSQLVDHLESAGNEDNEISEDLFKFRALIGHQGPFKLTEVCQLLEVSWQMCHAWIAHWTVARATLTMSRRSTRGERTHGQNVREPVLARAPFGAHVSPFGASSTRIQIMTRATSAQIKEPSMASDLHIKSSVPNTYQ